MAGIPSTSKPVLNYKGPPCHVLCDCGCCDYGDECRHCFQCTVVRCMIPAHLIDTPSRTPSECSVDGEEGNPAAEEGSSLESVEIATPEPICARNCNCGCCPLNMCKSCPECSCYNNSWPTLADMDSLLDAPQIREDPEMVDLIEEATADEEASANDAFCALPDMMEDMRRVEDEAGLPHTFGELSDDFDVDIGPTFFHDEYANTVTECGNDVQ